MIFFANNLKVKRKIKGLSQGELAGLVGLKANSISNYENSVSTPDFDTLGKLVKYLDISIDDLLFKNLDKAVTPTVTPTVSPTQLNEPSEYISGSKIRILPVMVDKDNNERIIFVPIRAQAGYLKHFQDPEFVKDLPHFSIVGFTNGSYRAFEVEGDSMEETILAKDIVIARFIDDFRWMITNEVYVINSDRGVVVKRVVNRLDKDNVAECHSDNSYYPHYELNFSEIREVWKVVGLIRTTIRKPLQLEQRINTIEITLDQIKRKIDNVG